MKISTKNATQAIESLTAFKTSGGMHAEWVTKYGPAGALVGQWRAFWQAVEMDAVSGDGLPVYVVYSYATPIAWVVGNVAYIPNERYSVTTSKHQGQARMGLSRFVVESEPVGELGRGVSVKQINQ